MLSLFVPTQFLYLQILFIELYICTDCVMPTRNSCEKRLQILEYSPLSGTIPESVEAARCDRYFLNNNFLSLICICLIMVLCCIYTVKWIPDVSRSTILPYQAEADKC